MPPKTDVDPAARPKYALIFEPDEIPPAVLANPDTLPLVQYQTKLARTRASIKTKLNAALKAAHAEVLEMKDWEVITLKKTLPEIFAPKKRKALMEELEAMLNIYPLHASISTAIENAEGDGPEFLWRISVFLYETLQKPNIRTLIEKGSRDVNGAQELKQKFVNTFKGFLAKILNGSNALWYNNSLGKKDYIDPFATLLSRNLGLLFTRLDICEFALQEPRTFEEGEADFCLRIQEELRLLFERKMRFGAAQKDDRARMVVEEYERLYKPRIARKFHDIMAAKRHFLIASDSAFVLQEYDREQDSENSDEHMNRVLEGILASTERIIAATLKDPTVTVVRAQPRDFQVSGLATKRQAVWLQLEDNPSIGIKACRVDHPEHFLEITSPLLDSDDPYSRHLAPEMQYLFSEQVGGQTYAIFHVPFYENSRDLFALFNSGEGIRQSDQTIRKLLPVMGANASLHAKGIAHGDVKPANVLLVKRDAEEHGLLTDVNGAYYENIHYFSMSQTPHYLDASYYPSILYKSTDEQDFPRFDQYTDVFAWGLVLLESWCGENMHEDFQNTIAVLNSNLLHSDVLGSFDSLRCNLVTFHRDPSILSSILEKSGTDTALSESELNYQGRIIDRKLAERQEILFQFIDDMTQGSPKGFNELLKKMLGHERTERPQLSEVMACLERMFLPQPREYS